MAPGGKIGMSPRASKPSPGLVHSGQRISDAIVVTNHGPSDAEGLVLDYQVPKGTRLVSVHGDPPRCSRAFPLTCELGTLKPGKKLRLTVVMAPAHRSGVFTMREVLGSMTYDPNLSNNTSRTPTGGGAYKRAQSLLQNRDL